MKYIEDLKECIRILASHGESALVSDLLCAYAALTDSEMPRVDLTYSSVMRHLRANNKDLVVTFEKEFKKSFEEALESGLDEPENIALLSAISTIGIELWKDFTK